VNHNGNLVRDCSAVPAVRRWLGDQAVVYIKPPARIGRKDIERISKLFPEAVTWDGGDITISFSNSPPQIAPETIQR
jgi:hypothetical protein